MTAKSKITLLVVLLLGAVAALLAQSRKMARLQAELESAHSATAAPKAGHPAALASILNLTGKSDLESMRQVLDFVDHLNPADARGVLNSFSKLPQNAVTDFAKKLVLSRWAEADPTAALAWAKGRTLYDGRGADIATVFDAWTAKNPAAALAAVRQVDDAKARDEIYQNIFTRLAATDPANALATLRSLPAGQQPLNAYGQIFYTWALQNPAAAAAAAQNLPPSLARNQAMQQLAYGWAQEDPAAALAWANTHVPAGKSRTDALMSVLMSIAAQDPQKGTAYLGTLPDGPAKNSLIVSFAANWAASDPAAAIAWMDTVATGQIHDQALQSILAQLSEANPARAADVLSQISLASVRDVALPQLASAWAQQDIQGALAWVQSLPKSDADARNQAFRNVVGTWSLTDPASAAAFVLTIPKDPNFRGMTDVVTQNWANADPAAAFAWAQALPSAGSGAQANAMRTALSTYANVDPQAAWDLAEQATWSRNTQPPNDPNAGIQTKTLANIVIAWSTQDGAAAAAHLADMPQGSISASATNAVLSNWIKQDPHGASQAIDALPPSPARDSAVTQLINVEGKNDLPTAFAWAATISNPASQNNAYTTVLQEWAKRDPAAASAAVQAANVSDAQRANMQQIIFQYSQAGAIKN